MKKLTIALLTVSALLLLTACDGGPNMVQRADILSQNAHSITIEHSNWGKKIAFGMADKHCTQYGKTAVYQSSSQQYGPDVISSWKCEKS